MFEPNKLGGVGKTSQCESRARACGSAVSHDVQDAARVEPREQLTQRGLRVAGGRDERLVVPGHVADGEQVGALLRLVRMRMRSGLGRG